jgi:hypothetical protein
MDDREKAFQRILNSVRTELVDKVFIADPHLVTINDLKLTKRNEVDNGKGHTEKGR